MLSQEIYDKRGYSFPSAVKRDGVNGRRKKFAESGGVGCGGFHIMARTVTAAVAPIAAEAAAAAVGTVGHRYCTQSERLLVETLRGLSANVADRAVTQ